MLFSFRSAASGAPVLAPLQPVHRTRAPQQAHQPAGRPCLVTRRKNTPHQVGPVATPGVAMSPSRLPTAFVGQETAASRRRRDHHGATIKSVTRALNRGAERVDVSFPVVTGSTPDLGDSAQSSLPLPPDVLAALGHHGGGHCRHRPGGPPLVGIPNGVRRHQDCSLARRQRSRVQESSGQPPYAGPPRRRSQASPIAVSARNSNMTVPAKRNTVIAEIIAGVHSVEWTRERPVAFHMRSMSKIEIYTAIGAPIVRRQNLSTTRALLTTKSTADLMSAWTIQRAHGRRTVLQILSANASGLHEIAALEQRGRLDPLLG